MTDFGKRPGDMFKAVYDSDEDGVIATAQTEADKFVDRGDPAAYDWTVIDFTTDGNWHDLDCSSIVPAGATFILFRLRIRDNLTATEFFLRKKGNSNSINIARILITAINLRIDQSFLVACDANRVVEYGGTVATFTTLDLVVAGWII